MNGTIPLAPPVPGCLHRTFPFFFIHLVQRFSVGCFCLCVVEGPDGFFWVQLGDQTIFLVGPPLFLRLLLLSSWKNGSSGIVGVLFWLSVATVDVDWYAPHALPRTVEIVVKVCEVLLPVSCRLFFCGLWVGLRRIVEPTMAWL